jgi:hypothetical protein
MITNPVRMHKCPLSVTILVHTGTYIFVFYDPQPSTHDVLVSYGNQSLPSYVLVSGDHQYGSQVLCMQKCHTITDPPPASVLVYSDHQSSDFCVFVAYDHHFSS